MLICLGWALTRSHYCWEAVESKSSFMSYVGISIQGNIRDCVSLFDKERGF